MKAWKNTHRQYTSKYVYIYIFFFCPTECQFLYLHKEEIDVALIPQIYFHPLLCRKLFTDATVDQTLNPLNADSVFAPASPYLRIQAVSSIWQNPGRLTRTRSLSLHPSLKHLIMRYRWAMDTLRAQVYTILERDHTSRIRFGCEEAAYC